MRLDGRWIGWAVAAALGAGCGDAGEGGASEPLAAGSYEATIQPIWDEHCVTCHYGSALDLSGPGSRQRLLEHEVSCWDDELGEVVMRPAVVPGSPEESILWRKIANADTDFGYGREMPPTGQGGLAGIDPDAFAAVEAWIRSGAPE